MIHRSNDPMSTALSAVATELPRSCHDLRQHGLKYLAVTGEVDGRRGRRHQRLKHLYSLCTYMKDKVNPVELLRASEDRRLWHHVVANIVEDGMAP